ncbi:AAA ATPase-like protein [Archangium gephyra]|uniref:AAA ATPase-like protein n=1 Tax=Archangium gephyra TaxID=48 RepID=A0AAC8QIB7_9BACT|nr:effector-associated domain EAD1-containing protein [Archangium gephyra]AKJ08089.1 Hypothetical protein AA314_09715 [Archangium gephyra]REG29826.1 AAA ATPase-like protein [Archangium gephyra]
MSDTTREWTAQLVSERLRNLKAFSLGMKAPVSPQQEGYREAASVLAWFDPTALRPLGLVEHASIPPSEFLSECILVHDAAGRSRWCLKPELRKQVLRGLVRRSAVEAALAANPNRPDEPLQRMLEACLRGEVLPVEQLDAVALASALQVRDWLEGVVPVLPDAERLRQRLALEELLKPLRRLTGAHFRGREAELEQLRRYTGVLRPTSLAGRIEFVVREVFSLDERPPLVIHGPGGMGKSTLLARFILEHVERSEDDRFPFAYLDFDHPSLRVEEPLTLLAEVFRQVGFQYPSQRDFAEELRRELLELLARDAFTTSSLESFRSPIGDLVALLRKASAESKPFLLVLDTFEEVQYTSRSYIGALFSFIQELQNAVPRLRTVIAGRIPISEFKNEPLVLGELDLEAAEGFLFAQGLQDERLVKAVVAKIGGNPLSLKLAAELARKEGAFNQPRTILPFVREARIQGELYQRILGHIHDEDVRKLAHPGLVLRVVTPDLIAKVLAAPCGVIVPDEARAQNLFKQLARETALITVEGDVLRHRQDVRRVMLELLRADKPDQVEEIHRKAVEYHARYGEPLHRAEEIYHRLSLGEEPASVAFRWMPEVAPYLRSAVEELPLRQRAFLASRLNLELDEKTRAEADLVDWERDAKKRVQELMSLGDVGNLEEALAILNEREDRTENSALLFLEAHILERLDHLAKARAIAKVALKHAERARRRGEWLELQGLLTRLDEREGRSADALSRLAEAAEQAGQLGDGELSRALDALRSRVHLRLVGNSNEEADIVLDGEHRRELNDSLLLAFPRYSELEKLVALKLGFRLSEISSGGSQSRVIFDLIYWAEGRRMVRWLIQAAREMNPGHPSLAAIASKLLLENRDAPEPTPSRSRSRCLTHERLLKVHDAAVSAGLARAREELLAGVEPRVVSGLPLQSNTAGQLLSDLTRLNQISRLDTGLIPLRTWLENALEMTDKRREQAEFKRALRAIDD